MISQWHVTGETWIQSKASQCEICSAQSGTGTGFPLSVSLHRCYTLFHLYITDALQYEQLTASFKNTDFSSNCVCLIVTKCTCATLNYKHKLRKITAKYWQREVTDENRVLFLFLHTLSSQVLQGTDWILGSLVSRTTTRDSNATPLLWIYIKITKEICMTWNFPLPWIPMNIVLSQPSFCVSRTPKYRVRQWIRRILSVKKITSIGYHDTVTFIGKCI